MLLWCLILAVIMSDSPPRKWKLKLFLLLAILTGGAYFYVQQPGSQAAPSFTTSAVDRGDLEQAILATGKLEPVLNVEVGSQVSGNLAEVLVDFNSLVTQGQVIARLDTTTFEANVREAEGELENADAALELAKVEATRIEQLRERDLVSQAELDQARARLLQAQATRNMRQHSLDRAHTELDRCTIISPIDGIVISRNVDVGQTVAASMTAPVLFIIANDLRHMHIHAHVPEADIGDIREGQRATFTVDAFRQTFTGRVVQVRNQPIIENHVVMYDTIIEVENPEGILKPGMTATVSIITAEKPDVLRVRNTALRARLPDALLPPAPAEEPASGDGDWHTVHRVLAPTGRLESVRVRAGMTDGIHTEVLEGLEVGDTLATGVELRNENDARPGTRLFGPEPAQF